MCGLAAAARNCLCGTKRRWPRRKATRPITKAQANGYQKARASGSLSMGVFSEWQPRYATVGIATVPVNPDNKKPLVSGWQRFGCPGSTALASKPRFQSCNGIAFRCGARSKITILDIDVADEQMLQGCRRGVQDQGIGKLS